MKLLTALLDILVSIVGGVFGLLSELPDAFGKKEHGYKAEFGKKYKLTRRKSAVLYIGNDPIDLKLTMTSAVLIGKTGSGKSTSVYFSSLLRAPKPKKGDQASMSYFVLDPAMELEKGSAAYLESLGYETETINFLSPEFSTLTWNPIAGLSDAEITLFANEYIETALGKGSSDPFWNLSAARVLAASIRLVKLFGYDNLVSVRRVVQSMSGDLEAFQLLISQEVVSQELFDEFASILSMGVKLRGSVLATTLSSLQVFSDQRVAVMTDSSSIDMKSFRKKSKVLYIQNRVMDQSSIAILNTLFFSRLFKECMKEIPVKDENTIGFFLDELSSLEGMRSSLMALASSNLRKHRAFFVGGFQSVFQMQSLYSKQHTSTILQNVSRLYFSGQDYQTARELSDELGRYSYTENEQQRSRELLTADEVTNISPESGLLFASGQRGVLLKRIKPYYKNRMLVKRSKLQRKKRKYINNIEPRIIGIHQIVSP